MTRPSSAAYVTAVLKFLQAFNRNDLDACESLLDPQIEWHSAVDYTGREAVPVQAAHAGAEGVEEVARFKVPSRITSLRIIRAHSK